MKRPLSPLCLGVSALATVVCGNSSLSSLLKRLARFDNDAVSENVCCWDSGEGFGGARWFGRAICEFVGDEDGEEDGAADEADAALAEEVVGDPFV